MALRMLIGSRNRQKETTMKTSILKLSLILAAGMLLACASNVQAVNFGYASSNGALIDCPGNHTFSFIPGVGGHDFQVTTGTAAGLFGNITGTFTIGTITVNGSTESAPVTGAGTFVITKWAHE